MVEEKDTLFRYRFAAVLLENKWQSQNLRATEIMSRNGNIKVTDRMDDQEDNLLRRCGVGYCREEFQKKPTLAEISRRSLPN